MTTRLLLIFCAACSSRSSGTPAAAAAPAPVAIDARAVAIDAAPPAPDASALTPAADGSLHGPMPASIDPRVTALLDEPMPADVVVRFAEISRTPDQTANERWDLHRDGRLYFVRHSGDKTSTASFDRPFPEKVSRKVDDKHMREIFMAFAAQHFADHPGYETVAGATGGTFVIVRALSTRDAKDLHTVVFDASRPDLLDFLETVTVML
jgi:hypothetical protein